MALLTLLVSGCREDEDTYKPPPADGPSTSDTLPLENPPSTAKETTIDKILSGAVPETSQVILKDVVVTAVDQYGSYTGDVYVQDPKGGVSSGLKLYSNSRTESGKKIADLKIGDHVNVEGTVKYWIPTGGFNDPNCPSKVHVKELEKTKITFLSSGTAPPPVDVKAADLKSCTKAETLEHVVVRLTKAGVASVYTNTTKGYTTVTTVEGNEISDDLYKVSDLKKGDCRTFTGVVVYAWVYRIHPRQAADIKTETGCATSQPITIQDIQDTTSSKHPAEKSTVTVIGVVTAVDANPDTSGNYEGFFIQDKAGGQYSGIYVYHNWTASSPATEVPKLHDNIELTGTYQEYYNVSELSYVTWTVKGQSSAIVTALANTADVATGGKDAEKYEGVLIQVDNIEVGTATSYGFQDKVSKLYVENMLYDFLSPTPPAVGTKYTSIIGPLHYTYSNFKILPRSSSDMKTQ